MPKMPQTIRHLILALTWCFWALADVEVTNPRPGDSIVGLTFNTEWQESGIAPLLSEFASYQLFLCAGGNDETTYMLLSTLVASGDFTDGNSALASLSPGLGANVRNAYFLKFVSAISGGTVVNFSDRFSLTDMNGTFPSVVNNALQSITGTAGPPDQNNVVSQSVTPSTTNGIVFQSSFSTSSTTRASSTSETDTISVTTSARSSSSATEVSDDTALKSASNPLSTGARAGIGAGIAALVIATIALMLLWIRRRNPQKTGVRISDTRAPSFSSGSQGTKVPFEKAELEGSPGVACFVLVGKQELCASTTCINTVVHGQETMLQQDLIARAPDEKELAPAERQIPVLPQAIDANLRSGDIPSPSPRMAQNEDSAPKYLVVCAGQPKQQVS